MSISRRDVLKAGSAAVVVAYTVRFTPARAQSATTFDYYISPTGDDVLGNGTLSNPWSITALNSKHSTYGGKRVGLLPGVYQYGTSSGTQTTLYSILSKLSSANTSCALQVQGGTSSSPTYIGSSDSSGNYSARTAILDGSNPSGGGQPTGGGMFIGQSVNGSTVPTVTGYITFDGIVVRNWNFAGIGFGGNVAGNNYVWNGINILNCEISNGGGVPSSNNPGAIFFWKNAPGILIQNCMIHDITTTPGGANSPWGMAAVMFNQDAGTGEGFTGTVDHCTMYHVGQGVTTKNNYSNVVVQYCYIEMANMGAFTGGAFQSCIYAGTQAPGNTVTYKYNVLVGGIWEHPEDGTANAGSVVATNNTIYCGPGGGSSTDTLFFVFDNNGSSGSGTFNHNIVWSDGGYTTNSSQGSIGYNSAGAGMNFNYNYYGTGCTFGAGGYLGANFTSWKSRGNDANSSTISSTPFVTSPASLNVPSFKVATQYLTAADGKPCGALNSSGLAADGSGGVGCDFSIPNAPVLSIVS